MLSVTVLTLKTNTMSQFSESHMDRFIFKMLLKQIKIKFFTFLPFSLFWTDPQWLWTITDFVRHLHGYKLHWKRSYSTCELWWFVL